MRPSLAVVVAAAFAFAAGSATSAVMTLDCRVQSAKPGYRRAGVRRLQFDMVARTVSVSDDTGRGFQERGVRPLVGVRGDRVVIENSGGKTSYFERRSGRYYFRNDAEKLVIEGHCVLLGRDANPL